VKKKILFSIAGIVALASGYWALSPLFVTKEAHDGLPATELTELDDLDEIESIGGIDTEKDLNDIDDISEVNKSQEKDEPVVKPPEKNSPEILSYGPFEITGTSGHPASGNVRVIPKPTMETVIQYENYSGTNCPDLHVYLASDMDATKFIDLGEAKGDKGDTNYLVREGVNLTEYPYVLTWCRAFGVLFDYAKIN